MILNLLTILSLLILLIKIIIEYQEIIITIIYFIEIILDFLYQYMNFVCYMNVDPNNKPIVIDPEVLMAIVHILIQITTDIINYFRAKKDEESKDTEFDTNEEPNAKEEEEEVEGNEKTDVNSKREDE